MNSCPSITARFPGHSTNRFAERASLPQAETITQAGWHPIGVACPRANRSGLLEGLTPVFSWRAA
jgi:hypothetical protein